METVDLKKFGTSWVAERKLPRFRAVERLAAGDALFVPTDHQVVENTMI